MLIHDSSTPYPNSMEITMDEDDLAVDEEKKFETPGTVNDVAVRIYTSGSTGSPK